MLGAEHYRMPFKKLLILNDEPFMVSDFNYLNSGSPDKIDISA